MFEARLKSLRREGIEKELVMRRIIMTWAAAAALFAAAASAAAAAEAVTIAAPAGLVRTAQVVNVVPGVPYVCGWWGRRCWTIAYAYYYRPYYVYSPYPYYRP
jgi:hypothetical protein